MIAILPRTVPIMYRFSDVGVELIAQTAITQQHS
jgi:hypothetical protein